MTEPTLQERLLEYAGWTHYDQLRDLLTEAADALDARDARDARIVGLEAMLCDAQAEVERLREALRVILDALGRTP